MEYSGRFIDAAQSIQSGKELPYGDGKMVASIPVSEGVDPSRVIFKQVGESIYNIICEGGILIGLYINSVDHVKWS